MSNLIENYWWLIWGVVGAVFVCRYNLRNTPTEDPETGEKRGIITRIVDPTGRKSRNMGNHLLLMGIGVLMGGAVFGLFKLYLWVAGK